MIRVVSLRKATVAGMAGAAAWEVVLRSLELGGFPLFDIVRGLGTLAFPNGPALAWWAAGMAVHLVVGALWAIFYAYFFWSRFDWAPALQGLVFSALPALLAIGIAGPQLATMHVNDLTIPVGLETLLPSLEWRAILGMLLGHAIWGAVLGALYTHPVGYRTGRRHRTPAPQSKANDPGKPTDPPIPAFVFATGIECSYPTIEHGRWRQDQMETTGHYRHWRRDFELVRELGATHLRYGPPLHLIFLGPDRYDWSFTDLVMPALRDQGIEAIVDLCHFGVPDWLENFQNPKVPDALRDYARAFAARYPWIRFYTPVNEMFVCAKLSALDGVWNEQRRDEHSFVTAVAHLAKANILMMDAILEERADAIFIHSESSEFYQACCPDPEIVRIAAFENERRFLPLDLLYAHPVSDTMRDHLLANGMSPLDYAWFQDRRPPRRIILGIDYYEWNEKLVDSDGNVRSLGELFGWYVIAQQYWERYRVPLMHTETNRLDAREGPRWLWRQWHNVQLLRQAGVPIVGFTWYSLTDQADWEKGLSSARGIVNPVGLYDLNRDVRPVGLAYKYLIDLHAGQPESLGTGAWMDIVEDREQT
jgi:beta-glucosidase/6-phospho-beta-glucosidase/beta-galactosidase